MKRQLLPGTVALAVFGLAGVAFAGDDVTSLSYISYLERYATIRPAHGDESLDAVVNMPILSGDRLDTSRGARVEVQLADGSTVWVDEFSTVDFDALALSRDDPSPRTVLYLVEGTAAIEVPTTASGDGALRLDSAAGTVYLNQPGLYRLELRGSQIRVVAYAGFAELPSGVGSAILRAGEEATVGEGGMEKAAIQQESDDFWNWVQERRHPSPGSRTAQYVDTRDAGRAAVLDNYGDWVYVSSFSSWMWRPRVAVGWVPYSHGRWYWTPVGWSWISYEPWGWYPFHYGSWYLDAGFGWVWGWDSVWAPAWVTWLYTPGYVGWCPRGYYDWWYVHNCTHCWGGGWHHPGRWSEVAFDFSGRVHMAGIDPHPWTFVSTGQFSSTHLDRVRLDPNRFLSGLPGDRTGVVRSGPMVTPLPGRGAGDRDHVESFFRSGTSNREVPDLSTILRRGPVTGDRALTPLPGVNPSRTADLVTTPRLQIPGTPSRTVREGTLDRGGTAGTGGTATGVGVPVGRTTERPNIDRGRTGREGTGSTGGRSDATGRTAPEREVVRPPSRDVGRTRESGSVRDGARVRETGGGRVRESGSGSSAGSSSGAPSAPPSSSSPPPPPPPPPSSSSPSSPPPPPERPAPSERPPARQQSRWLVDGAAIRRDFAGTVRRGETGPGSVRVNRLESDTSARTVERYRAPSTSTRTVERYRAPVAVPRGVERYGTSVPREVYIDRSAQTAPATGGRGAWRPSYEPRSVPAPSAVHAPRSASPPSSSGPASPSSTANSSRHSSGGSGRIRH